MAKAPRHRLQSKATGSRPNPNRRSTRALRETSPSTFAGWRSLISAKIVLLVRGTR